MTTLASAPSEASGVPSGRDPLTGRRQIKPVVRALVALTKPRIIELLLITTVPAMVLAQRGWPAWSLVGLTLVGGTLAAASANTINCYVDRDIDQLMKRTARRPLAQAKALIRPVEALRFGILLGVGATCLFGFAINWPSALLADGAIAVYVFVYTLGLKRRTPNNIVIGGAAGCFPALIGWSAVTGNVGWPAVVLFGVIFFWTPPHFWALAMKFKDDYAAAGVPMLPVVAEASAVARQIVWYSYAMVATSLLLGPIGNAGWLYLGTAVVTGVVFLREAHLLQSRIRRGVNPKPMRLFHWSITYLTVLFVAVAVGQFTF